jgi:hypothetical protein
MTGHDILFKALHVPICPVTPQSDTTVTIVRLFSLRVTFRINHAEDRVGLLGDTEILNKILRLM